MHVPKSQVFKTARGIKFLGLRLFAGRRRLAIAAANDIRVKIPAVLDMTWDPSVTTATISGGASGKVSTTVSYAGNGATLVLDVTSDFVNGDTITVNGLSFKNFWSGWGYLILDTGNNRLVAAIDSHQNTVSTADFGSSF